MRRVRPPCAGISRVTAWESEHGFCVKAVREPVGRVFPQPVLESLAGVRPTGQYIRTVAGWSSSQNNNNNNAWNQNFNNGNQNNNNKNNTNNVRAIRGFTQKQTGGKIRPAPVRKLFSFWQAPLLRMSMQPELFDDISAIPLEDIFSAYYECRRHKRNRAGALQFEVNLESNLVELWEEINSDTWEPRPSTVFIIEKPVVREIFAASFRDRIVHHLVISRLNALFEKFFVFDSYSCRKGKGTHFGVSRAARFIRRSGNAWILKIDIRGYFMSINRKILYGKLERFINEQYYAPDKARIKELCRVIIFNDPTKNCIYRSPSALWKQLPKDKSLFSAKKGCGLPIGNLTSQIFANFYLTGFDHFIKKECGIRNYGRYVDDCLLVHHSRAFLKRLISGMRKYLLDNLKLTLHPRKIYLQPCCNGVKFLGCFIKPSHIVINHRTLTNFKKALFTHNRLVIDHRPDKDEQSAFISSVNSYLGILRHYKTYRQRRHIMKNHISPFWYKHIAFHSNKFEKIIIRHRAQI